MPEFVITSRTVSERKIYVRASSASEAMRLVRLGVEAPDFFRGRKSDSPGIFNASDREEISQTFRHSRAPTKENPHGN